MQVHHIAIFIHPQAPTKPRVGAACNGCGVCCLVEPCPLGMLLSRRRTGACVAVQWCDEVGQYRCAAARGPWAILARRWIAVGVGCDSDLVDPRSVDDNRAHD